MDQIGAGKRHTWFAAQEVFGVSAAIPTDPGFIPFCKAGFPALVFDALDTPLVTFDEVTGIYEFHIRGHMQLIATINLDTTGVSEFFASPEFKRDPGAWGFLNARSSDLPVIGKQQIVMTGSVDIEKGDQLRFQVAASNAQAKFSTRVLGNNSVIPALALDFLLFVR